MAVRKDPHLDVNGTPKHPYATAGKAWGYVWYLQETGQVPEGFLRAYQCPRCRQYHVGKRPRPVPHRRSRRGSW